MPESIKIDIWSDVACPWCYIGKRKLEAAMRTYGRSDGALPIEIEYHSFELSPDTPEKYEGTIFDFLMVSKGVSRGQVEQMLGDVTGRAAQVGLRFDYEHHEHANTRKALQLLHYAKAHGVELEMSEVLFRAHFTDGKHVGSVEVLAELGAELGLDADDITRSLNADEHIADVDADIDEARRLGIQGVPFYVFDGRFGVSGAQDPSVFEQVLRQLQNDRVGAEA